MQLSDIIPEGVPQGYFNGYALGNSHEDFVIVLAHNGRATIALNTTPSHAKALALHLLRMIEEIEKTTGQTIREFQGHKDSVEQGEMEA
jgi:hypothetical protein